MSKRSARRKRKRRPKPVRLFSTEFFRRSLRYMDEFNGFDYEAGFFRKPAGWEQRRREEAPVEFERCHHGIPEGSCFECALGRKRLRAGWVTAAVALVVFLVTLMVFISFRR